MNADGYVPVKTVAERFNVSPSTIYRLIKSGGLDAIRVGRTVRVPADAVRQLAGSREEVRKS